MNRPLQVGDVVVAAFPKNLPPGREQEGYRPAIIIGVPERLGVPRFSVVLVVPLTTDRNQAWVVEAPALYLRLKAGIGNLPSASIVLLDQIRSVDRSRVLRYLGTVDDEQYRGLRDRLIELLYR